MAVLTEGDPSQVEITVLVVNYNTRHLLDEMMAALQAATDGLPVQVIVVDNASRDGSADYFRSKWPQHTIIANTSNVGFGRANNQAVPLVRGDKILLLNTDAFVSPGSIRIALAQLDRHPDCGVLGVRLVGRDGAVQPSCRYFPTPWNMLLGRIGLSQYFPGTQLVDDINWDDRLATECDWVPGAFLMTRKAVVNQVGLFDSRYFIYYEEVDFCRAAKTAGWTVRYCPDTDVVHIGGESAKSDGTLSGAGRQLSALQMESELLYFRKHRGFLGVMSSVLLNALGDSIQAVKKLFGGGQGAGPLFATTLLAGRLLFLTRFATRPTR
ncbi:MAG: glycosyltransferase family 2 protein [Steroidobacteraceae bacterium]